MYTPLHDSDRIRLLELVKYDRVAPQLRGRLITARLRDRPKYYALSYVWGSKECGQPLLLQPSFMMPLGNNISACLKELGSDTKNITVWVDQICINQGDEHEKEQQVRLMAKIYSQAQQVIGWLGESTPSTSLAMKAFQVLGLSFIEQDNSSRRFRKAVRRLFDTGHLSSLSDIGDPNRAIWRATTSMVQLNWFRRLWIVQEVVLATDLQLRCGKDAIAGDIFFAGVEAFSTFVTSPPNPWLLEPYRNALKLGKLRKYAASRNTQSYPWWAQTLSGWDCEKSQDRLNALYGIAFRDDKTHNDWFMPRYDLSAPQLYEEFARSHIWSTRSLAILQFAGCGDGDAFVLSKSDDGTCLQLRPPADDVPSWIPDWRIRTRPIALLTRRSGDIALPFCATVTEPVYSMEPSTRVLRVRAREVDEIVACGLPYCGVVRGLGLNDHDIIRAWYELAQKLLDSPDIRSLFAFNLLMGGRIQVMERPQISITPTKVIEYFEQWAIRNLDILMSESHDGDSSPIADGIDKSTHFGYLAEEICRNRSFFVTKRGFMGLGSLTVAPSASVVFIHGLKTPFVVQRSSDRDVFRGECYVHGLMDAKLGFSEEDMYLNLA